jgi:predicted nucleotidyltransferase
VFEFVLTPAERALLQALDALGVRFLVVGMAAALLEGAPGTTQDLDLWLGSVDESRLREAARRAGGFYTSGFGIGAPAVGGAGLDRLDLVTTAHGLDSFDDEYQRAREFDLDGLRVRSLSLERVLASKRATGRPKDLAQIPLLEATLAARRAADDDS